MEEKKEEAVEATPESPVIYIGISIIVESCLNIVISGN
jgi:hypothetical protein